MKQVTGSFCGYTRTLYSSVWRICLPRYYIELQARVGGYISQISLYQNQNACKGAFHLYTKYMFQTPNACKGASSFTKHSFVSETRRSLSRAFLFHEEVKSRFALLLNKGYKRNRCKRALIQNSCHTLTPATLRNQVMMVPVN